VSLFLRIKQAVIGEPRNPLDPKIHRHVALIAFLAWIGLGADGLSSACYGPEEAFIALGVHTHLALYLALMTALTVFIISFAYNQIIELFPSGGGGYKVASTLLGPYTGLIAGAALIVDYMLTIVTSAASSMDALFSLLPPLFAHYKLSAEIILLLVLIILNLRGMKDSIKVLLPVFVGFVLTHTALIVYGIIAHGNELPIVISDTLQDTYNAARSLGWVALIGLLLRAYSYGSGTYTGIEAVSNNVNTLAEPRVSTGKWTMFYMALSLSFTAAGFILLYLLWHVAPQPGLTLNAITFKAILGDSMLGHLALTLVLLLEAGLLVVAANTGFLAGPSVLANMAVDSWLPKRFRHLSSRLVIQNGIILFGLAALALLIWSRGHVSTLVVLYSINVFITFSLSLFGLCVYWWQHRKSQPKAKWRLMLSSLGFIVSASILMVTLFSKFAVGGWLTLLITSIIVLLCLLVKKHYTFIHSQLQAIEALFSAMMTHQQDSLSKENIPILDPEQPTAVFLVGKSYGAAMHILLSVKRLFPDYFKNFVFASVGEVDVQSFLGKHSLEAMRKKVEKNLDGFVNFCHQHGLAATSYCDYGTDPVELLVNLAEKIHHDFPQSLFFASKLVFENDNWFTRLLHNEFTITTQRRLHLKGMQLVILPMKI
jgi:amino acid transporter